MDQLRVASDHVERVVDRDRVVSTFNTKIRSYGIEDYLSFLDPVRMPPSFAQAETFLDIRQWMVMMLATVSTCG